MAITRSPKPDSFSASQGQMAQIRNRLVPALMVNS
jgi:hypothetical protein